MAAEARTAAEKAAAEAKIAAERQPPPRSRLPRTPASPGFVNLSVTGEFDDELVLLVGGTEVARSRGKLIALGPRPPGPA